MLLMVSVLILIFGLAATTRTQNITVGGYYPGAIVSVKGAVTSPFFKLNWMEFWKDNIDNITKKYLRS